MRLCFVLILSVFLNACATQVSTLQSGEQKELEQGKGFVLLGIETNTNLKSVQISGPQKIKLSSQDIKEGVNFLLIDLKAGQYTIDHISLGSVRNIDLDDELTWDFVVEPGKISYVGHLEWDSTEYNYYYRWLVQYRVELVNRSTEALEFLEENHSKILAKNAIVYGGPGEDRFFALLENLKGE